MNYIVLIAVVVILAYLYYNYQPMGITQPVLNTEIDLVSPWVY